MERKQCDVDQLVAAYRSGKTMKELEKMFGLTAPSIYSRLSAAGCKLKTMKLHEGETGCPCFRAVSFASIKCEAGEEWNHLSLHFDDKDKGTAFRRRFCMTENYTNCPFYQTFEGEHAKTRLAVN